MSTPWFPFPPVWDWPGISAEHADRARAYFVKKAELRHANSGPVRGCLYVCQLRSYASCIEKMHELGIFTTEHLTKYDVIRQLGHAEGFRRHDAIGRRIRSGTWQKETGPRTLFLTEEDIYPDGAP